MSDEKTQVQKEIQLPVEWYYPEGMTSKHATNMVIQHEADEFYISFFEFVPPILLGTQEMKEEMLASLDRVRATCVARITLTPKRVEVLIEALEQNYESYLSKQVDDEE